VNLKIRGVDFVTNLIVLESKDIYVILGMDWLSKHKVLINCAMKSVKLTTPVGKEIEFVAEPVATAKGVANHAKVNQLDASQESEVSVVNEFPDVFPKELLGMPPDRYIEFVIELKPGITPIYKTPYRMATPELAVTPSFKVKTKCIHLFVPGSIFTHKVTNSEISSITSIYYNIS
jgi:hypothetical protein